MIEDNRADVLLIREGVKKCSFPVRVTHAGDGEQALALLADQAAKPDLIILDMNLPKVSGPEILERANVNVPVVLFSSAHVDAPDVQRALALGAREFVHKPSGYEEFIETVCGIITRWVPVA